jgi:hypothetical protein
MQMNRLTKSYVLALALIMVATAGLACWQPHFTHTNAESPLFFENFLVGGHSIFNKNIYPGTMCVGALNTATEGEGADLYFRAYMDVGNENGLLIYDHTSQTYYDILTDGATALNALKYHIKIRPYVDPQSLTLSVNIDDPAHPIFSIPLSEVMTDGSTMEGTIWEVTFKHLDGNTVTIKRMDNGTPMPDDRIAYARQGGAVTSGVQMTASDLDGTSVATNATPLVTFARPMGAIYTAYIKVGDPTAIIPAIACDRSLVSGEYQYKFCMPANVSLESGATYFFGFVQQCTNPNSTGGCENGMALTQDMHGNPIAEDSLLSGWSVDDIGTLTGQGTQGVSVVYRRVPVQ